MKAYAVFNKKGKIIISTIKSTEQKSWGKFLNTKRAKDSDIQPFLDLGYTVRPIEITEIKEEK